MADVGEVATAAALEVVVAVGVVDAVVEGAVVAGDVVADADDEALTTGAAVAAPATGDAVPEENLSRDTGGIDQVLPLPARWW